MTSIGLAATLGIAGLIVGSLLALVSVRMPSGEDVVAGRSRCLGCDRRLAWFELVPVASYLALRGRCRTCQGAISARYPLIELAAGIIGLWAAFWGPGPVESVLTALLGWQLLLIAVVDLEHLWLPDRLTLPLVITGLVAAALIEALGLRDALIGAVVGFSSLWGLGYVYRHFRGRQGLGGGDPFLFAACGAWVGWQGLPLVLLIASSAGVCLIVSARIVGRPAGPDTRVPFAPLLSVGVWITWLLHF